MSRKFKKHLQLNKKLRNFVALENSTELKDKKTYFECVSASGEADETGSGSRVKKISGLNIN